MILSYTQSCSDRQCKNGEHQTQNKTLADMAVTLQNHLLAGC
jgi:hypothetical protein